MELRPSLSSRPARAAVVVVAVLVAPASAAAKKPPKPPSGGGGFSTTTRYVRNYANVLNVAAGSTIIDTVDQLEDRFIPSLETG